MSTAASRVAAALFLVLGLGGKVAEARPATSKWNPDHKIGGITFHNLEEFYHETSVAAGDHRRRGDSDFDLESILAGRTNQSTVYADWILRTNNSLSTEDICAAAGKDRCLQVKD